MCFMGTCNIPIIKYCILNTIMVITGIFLLVELLLNFFFFVLFSIF